MDYLHTASRDLMQICQFIKCRVSAGSQLGARSLLRILRTHGIRELEEFLPARLLSLRIDHFDLREQLHGLEILVRSALAVIGDGDLSQINREESLDIVPVLHVSVELLHLGGYTLHLRLLRALRLEHLANHELALLHLGQSLAQGSDSRDGLLLSGVARFLGGDGGAERVQVHDLAFDPVAHVYEGILEFFAEAVQLELEVGLVVAGHETHIIRVTKLHLALFVAVLVLGQEIGELFIVLELGLFHGHDLLDVHLELLQVAY